MLDTKAIQGTEVRLALPWPDRKLSPNARGHHFPKARAAKAARKTAWALTLEALHGKAWLDSGARLAWQFCPPSRRRHDIDNLIAQHKAAQDGIADALGIDDSKFTTTYSMGQHIKDGAVLVTIGRSA